MIDATQGVQAQTISVYKIAQQCGLTIIPVLNKVDLPASDPERCFSQLQDILSLDTSVHKPLLVSAKTGKGVDQVLQALVERTEPLGGAQNMSSENRQPRGLRALIFDSWYDQYRGVIALVSVMDGAIRKGDSVVAFHSGKRYDVLDLGINNPEPVSVPILRKGQVLSLIHI